MARKLTFIAVGASAWLGFGLLSGCNEILDIEQAQLSPSAGGGNTPLPAPGSLNVHGADCTTVTPKCSACITTACKPPDLNGCVGNKDCRAAMDGYNSCLGPSCSAQEDTCFAPLSAINGPVPDCMLGCEKECATSAIFSTCQLYCGCMVANCMQKFGDPTVPMDFASPDDCVNRCINFPPDIVTCRWSHCELAGLYPNEDHCDHAVGINICGFNSVAPRPAECPRDKSLDTFGCASNSECCSNFCNVAKNRSCAEQ
ncbi:MAG TPA: hypothetical protein VGF76_08570 [Polyangiaceae bacterium]|jgi:hypothetical protein